MKSKVFYFIWTFLLLSTGLQAQEIITENSLESSVSNCNDNADFCLDIALEDLQNYSITSNSQPYSGSVSGCNFDTLVNYYYNTLFGQGELGPYMLNQWTVNDTEYSGQFEDINDLVAQMNAWDPQGNWSHIQSQLNITGGSSDTSYGYMDIVAIATNQPSLVGVNFTISALGITLDFPVGEHQVIVIDNDSNAMDTVAITVTCQPNAETITINLEEDEVQEFCFDLSELSSAPVMTMNTCSNDDTGAATFNLVNAGTCVQIQGISAGQNVACFMLCDEANNCDMTEIIVNVAGGVETETFTFEDEIPANQEVYQICLDTLELPGTVVSIQNVCPEDSGSFVSFTVDANTYCVKYTGLECGGTETACIVICDDTNICDTTFLVISTDNTVCQPQPEYINNTIYQTQSFEYCFSTNDLPGTLESIENICEGTENVDFILNEETFCVTYTGMTIGQDNACIVVTDNFGNTDTTYFAINVITPQVEVITDVIMMDETMTYCLNYGELPGNVYTISNICEENSGENVNFQLDNVSLCIDAEALSIGTDSACIVICDENLICDTTYYYITVEEDSSVSGNIPPVAIDDNFTTTENTPAIFNVLGNDTIPSGSQVIVYIMPQAAGGSGPLNGTAIPNQNGTIRYTPSTNFCGTDQFDYVLCNQFGCDTALVVVNIECDNNNDTEIHVYNGFSPNGDSVNDFFHISGIENYPNNDLFIYNRWGSLVYQSEGYRNGWDGTSTSGEKTLPDGTYFYILNVEEIGEYKGYLEIKR